MGVSLNTDGLDDYIRRFEQLNGEHSVSLGELFPPEFMAAHSHYADFDTWFDDSSVDPERLDLENPPVYLDRYANETTDFDDFTGMLEAAMVEYVKRRLEN